MGYWTTLEPYCDAVDIYNGAYRLLETFGALSVVVRTLYAAHWCESELANGGFDQFFSSSTGALAPEAATALRDLGLPDVAEIVEEAMASLGDPYPRDQVKRQTLIAALADYYPDRLSDLDQRFWRACDSTGSGPHDGGRLHAAMDLYAEQQ